MGAPRAAGCALLRSALALVVALCAGGASASSGRCRPELHRSGRGRRRRHGHHEHLGDERRRRDDRLSGAVGQPGRREPCDRDLRRRRPQPGTGNGGDDYWFFSGLLPARAFFAWNGSAFARQTRRASLSSVPAANLNEFRIGKADLGGTSSSSSPRSASASTPRTSTSGTSPRTPASSPTRSRLRHRHLPPHSADADADSEARGQARDRRPAASPRQSRPPGSGPW